MRLGDTAEVVLDAALCVGATACALAAPTVFTLDADERGVPAADAVRVDAALLDAVAGCPTQAISLRPARGATRPST